MGETFMHAGCCLPFAPPATTSDDSFGHISQVRIQDLVKGGGPSKFVPIIADGAQRWRVSEASIHRPGSRAQLRALEALVFLSVKYACSHFSWHLFFKIFNL